MVKQLLAADLVERRNTAKEWLNGRPLKIAFKTAVHSRLDKIQNWDQQVASNTLVRQLRHAVCIDNTGARIPTSNDDIRIQACLERVFLVVAMQLNHKLPASFRNWQCPPYWTEIMNDVDRILAKQTLHTKWLNNIIAVEAIVVPKDSLKRAREYDDNAFQGIQKRLKASEKSIKESDTTIEAMRQHLCAYAVQYGQMKGDLEARDETIQTMTLHQKDVAVRDAREKVELKEELEELKQQVAVRDATIAQMQRKKEELKEELEEELEELKKQLDTKIERLHWKVDRFIAGDN